MAVSCAHFAVTKSIRSNRELQRHVKGFIGSREKFRALVYDPFYDTGIADLLQEVIQHDALIMLSKDFSCLFEVALSLVDNSVVGSKESNVKLRQYQVFGVS